MLKKTLSSQKFERNNKFNKYSLDDFNSIICLQQNENNHRFNCFLSKVKAIEHDIQLKKRRRESNETHKCFRLQFSLSLTLSAIFVFPWKSKIKIPNKNPLQFAQRNCEKKESRSRVHHLETRGERRIIGIIASLHYMRQQHSNSDQFHAVCMLHPINQTNGLK